MCDEIINVFQKTIIHYKIKNNLINLKTTTQKKQLKTKFSV